MFVILDHKFLWMWIEPVAQIRKGKISLWKWLETHWVVCLGFAPCCYSVQIGIDKGPFRKHLSMLC